YTGIFAKTNGGGFLTDQFPDSYKAIWDFHGVYATSRHVPGVRYAGITHPGLFGTAPSADLLAEWNRREQELISNDPNRVPPLALPPTEQGVLAGKLQGEALQKIGREGARTVPARENGGNHDIKNFTRGARVYYPVHVPGAKFSGGDLHFSQGDGEITFCGAIEIGGYIDFGVDLIKDGMNKYGVTTNPIFFPGPVEPRYSTFLSFVGVSVEDGINYYMNATVAYRRACLNAIEYLKKWGYTGEQAYLLLGSAPIEGRISGIVDIPNACCTLYLPTEIFDFDIKPNKEGPHVADRGVAARTS
ncbi:MAG TPA: acetamidase/formamidase family protein, partial [Candidatus Binatia bacterium]|nr:acetamidase/formamidase family protein [Candidatus Binatia bacterium]